MPLRRDTAFEPELEGLLSHPLRWWGNRRSYNFTGVRHAPDKKAMRLVAQTRPVAEGRRIPPCALRIEPGLLEFDPVTLALAKQGIEEPLV
jgi:hypothetical protein